MTRPVDEPSSGPALPPTGTTGPVLPVSPVAPGYVPDRLASTGAGPVDEDARRRQLVQQVMASSEGAGDRVGKLGENAGDRVGQVGNTVAVLDARRKGDGWDSVPIPNELPGGPAPLPTSITGEAPGSRTIGMIALDKAEQFAPRAVNWYRTGARYLGPIGAVAGFGLNAGLLIDKWHQLPTGAKVINGTATVASGIAAGAAVATAFHVAGAVPWALGAGGFSGTLLGASWAWKVLHDPKATPGQKGMAVLCPVLSAASTVLMFVPGGQPLAIALGAASAVTGLFGNWIGKNKTVNHVFSAVGHFLTHPFGL